jgi:scyllo-inositol 2-dehydrogenase (NADP+)
MRKIKVGLVGYGLSGSKFHTPFLSVLEEFEIAKVVSSKKEVVQQDLGNVEVVSSLAEVINDPAIDLVIITTPTNLHYEMAKQSLRAGKNVILEKPMVVETWEAEELINLAEEKNLLLSVYHNRRWDNDFLTVKRLVNEGKLGEINTYEVHFDRFTPIVSNKWKEQQGHGSGMLYDLGSHLIDQALYLFGLPQFVLADVFSQRDNAETDDYFHVILGYGKLRVILHTGLMVLSNGPRFQVHGSKGSFIKYGFDPQEAALKAGKKPINQLWGTDDPQFFGKLVTKEGEIVKEERIETLRGSYATYYKRVAESILEGKSAPVTAQEGLSVIKIIEAALKSSTEKKAIFLEPTNKKH